MEIIGGMVCGLITGVILAVACTVDSNNEYLVKVGVARYSAVSGKFIKDSAVVKGDTILMIRNEK